ncbi:MAG: choice-of-anchor X domain-containing protein [bacterium]
MSSCTEEIPTQAVDETPQIALIQAPRTVYQFPAQPAGIHVRAVDGQGVSDLSGVSLAVKALDGRVINTRQMADNGQLGDILPGDGQYFTPIDTSLLRNQTGTFVLEAVARDQSQNESVAAVDTLQVLAGVENRLPSITAMAIPEIIRIDTSATQIIQATASDPDGVRTIRHVLMEIYPSVSAQPVLVDTLRDNGLSGDGGAGDGVFGILFFGPRLGSQCQYFSFVLRPVDDTGGVGSAQVQTVQAIRAVTSNNTPPRVSELSAPATISRSAVPNTYVLSLKAEDPDTECNDAITRVFFNSFLPSGNPATGNPFAMRDDGQSGDATAGDGRYSLTIQITPQSATGAYRFEFQAQDRSGALSDKIVHTITVTP